MQRFWLVLPVALTMAPSGAIAQDRKVAKVLAPFERCGTVQDQAARLRCFDAALADATRVAADADREEQAQDRDRFGFSATDLERRRKAPGDTPPPPQQAEAEAPLEVHSTLTELFNDAQGKRVFLLENGQIWRELANSTYRGTIRPGWKVVIKRGGIGGFRLQFEGRTGFFSVRRQR